jgi:hypothetical protein
MPIIAGAEQGRIIAESFRPDFPTDFDRVILQIASQQAEVCLVAQQVSATTHTGCGSSWAGRRAAGRTPGRGARTAR